MAYPFKSVTVDANGSIVPSAAIEVRNRAGVLASIYDATGGALTNPFASDAAGEFEFYAEAGVYFITSGTDPSDFKEAVTLGPTVSFVSVAEMENDTSMRYAPDADCQTPIFAGEVITAGIYRYVVAAEGADAHLTTAGGVRLDVVPNDAGEYSVRAFGAVGDGVTDDTAVIQAAIYACKFRRLLFNGSFYCTDALYSPDAIQIIGDSDVETNIRFVSDVDTDGLVFGTRNVTAYADNAAFLADIGSLEDGWYNVDPLKLEFVQNNANTLSADRTIEWSETNRGYVLSGIRLWGAYQPATPETVPLRDVFSCSNVYKLCVDDVWLYGSSGRGAWLQNNLNQDFNNVRTDYTWNTGVEFAGDGVNTSAAMRGCYIRQTDTGAGLKSECLGLLVDGCIFEGIGGAGTTDIYACGIWIVDGVATIIQPYFEDVRGHNIFVGGGTAYITGGQNGSGAGADTALYAAVAVALEGNVVLSGAGYTPGGGNKAGVRVARTLAGNAQLMGAIFDEVSVMADGLASPTDYTQATYDEANITAINALTGMLEGETAFAQDDRIDYEYDGASWNKVSSNDFPGLVTARDVGGTDGSSTRSWGRNVTVRAGLAKGYIKYINTTLFDALDDGVANIQSGATIPANGSVQNFVSLGYTLSGYSGNAAKNFSIAFQARLDTGLNSQVHIENASLAKLVIYNYTNAPINLSSDVAGTFVVQRYDQDLDG